MPDATPGRILILSDLALANNADVAEWQTEQFARRRQWWAELATRRGWDLAVLDINEVLNDPASLPAARAAYIDMPFLRVARYRDVWNLCASRLGAAAVFGPPEEVEASLWLDRYHSILVRACIPVPRTALVPLSPEECFAVQSPLDLAPFEPRIHASLADAGLTLDAANPLFVRSLLCSLRTNHPADCIAFSPDTLRKTSWRVISKLRNKNDLGGLAFREFLPLVGVNLTSQRTATLEYRFWVLDRRVVMASFHGPFHNAPPADREIIAKELAARADQMEPLRELAGRVVVIPELPRSYTVDVVLRRDSPPVVIELNPLYSSGTHILAAMAWVMGEIGCHLAGMAGYETPTREERIETAGALSGAGVWPGPGVTVFD